MRRRIAYFAIGILVLGVFALGATSAPAPGVKMMPVPEPIQIVSQPTRMITVAYPDVAYTHLKISPGREHLRLQPGESEEIMVTVTTNADDEIYTEPHLVTLLFDDNPIDSKWIEITPASANISSDSKQEYTIAVDVPDDAEIGHYHSTIAFTDDVIGEGQYPKHLNTFRLSLEVWMPPEVQILTPYIYDQVEAGRTYDYTIELENTGDDPIAIDPEIEDEDRYCVASAGCGYGYAFGSDAISITAPDEIEPEEHATVKVHIAVPDDARGRYEGSIDLNIDDPGIREYEGRVHLSFEVIRYPTEPFVKYFDVSDDAQVTIEVTAHNWRTTDVEPSFVVNLTDPDGNSVDIGRTMKTHKGSVSFGNGCKMGMPYLPYPMPVPPGGTRDAADGGCSETSNQYTETHTADCAAGTYELRILPENTERFEYVITVE